MCRGLLCLYFALGVRLHAQFTDPRNYTNSPVNTNELELSYGYARSNASVDTSVVIVGAKLNLNAGLIDYTRTFSFFRRFAWVEAAVPIGDLQGSITGTNIQGSITGAGDSTYTFATLLKGGPALTEAQFQNFKPTTTLGVSFGVTAPTGQYNGDKVLNLGSHRWNLKPEIALSYPFRKWELDAYANINFYTDNTAYHGVEILKQQPLPGFEGHLSYSFTPNFWASLDTRYSFRGDTLVDGVNQDNSQQNFVLGSELNFSLNSKSSLVLVFAHALEHLNGPAYTGVIFKYVYSWGGGLH